MVQVIDLLSPAGNFGQGLGQGIGAGSQRLFEQGMTNRGLDMAQQAASGAKNPIELAFALARASAMSPDASRAMGPIFSQLLQNYNAGSVAQNLGNGGGNGMGGNQNGNPMSAVNNVPNEGPSNAPFVNKGNTIQKNESEPFKRSEERKEAQSGNDKIASDFLDKSYPKLRRESSEFGRVPTFRQLGESTFSSDKEGALRRELTAKNVPPQAQDYIVKRAAEDMANRFQESVARHGFDQQRQSEVNAKGADAVGQIEQRMAPLLQSWSDLPEATENIRQKAQEYALDEPVDLPPEIIAGNVMKRLSQDIRAVNNVRHNTGKFPVVRDLGDMRERQSMARQNFKILKERGLESAARDVAYRELDMGPVEFHDAMWGNQTSPSSLNRVASVKAPKFKEPVLGVPSLNPESNDANFLKQRDKYVQDLSGVLNKIKPDDDLILLRAQALNRGAKVGDFRTALQMAQDNGLELSEFQKSQEGELGNEPVPSLSEVFTPQVFGRWLDSKRGKQ